MSIDHQFAAQPDTTLRATSTLKVRSHRGPTQSRTQSPECVVELELTPGSYTEAIASLKFESREILSAGQSQFASFCRYSMGKPYRVWNGWFDSADASDATWNAPLEVSTRQQNTIKACLLTYLLIEPAFLQVRSPTLNIETALYDEFVFDFGGSPSAMPFIYFPTIEVHRQLEAALKRLYDAGLLSTLELRTAHAPGAERRYFTPLVIPGIRVDEFGGFEVEQLWRRIKSQMRAAIGRRQRRSG